MRTLFLFLLLFQDPKPVPKVPLPPDLSHVTEHPSCTILGHGVAEVFNADSKKIEEVVYYRAEPFATYDDGREKWTLPEETMAHSSEKRPGALGDFATSHEAVDACFDWIKAVQLARKKEIASLAHSTKK